ncbi:hypothetical protein [Jannaschia formosa]|nr:hypothetical protein [Jannaschia formosa]
MTDLGSAVAPDGRVGRITLNRSVQISLSATLRAFLWQGFS